MPSLCVAFFMAATYPLLWLVLKRNPLLWVLTHILSTATLPSLIVLWGAMVAAALATVQAQTSKANTRCRTIADFFTQFSKSSNHFPFA